MVNFLVAYCSIPVVQKSLDAVLDPVEAGVCVRIRLWDARLADLCHS